MTYYDTKMESLASSSLLSLPPHETLVKLTPLPKSMLTPFKQNLCMCESGEFICVVRINEMRFLS